MSAVGLDHAGLTVSDIERALGFGATRSASGRTAGARSSGRTWTA